MEMDEVYVQLYTPPSIDQLYSFLQLITTTLIIGYMLLGGGVYVI
jgi:hypothetical protein